MLKFVTPARKHRRAFWTFCREFWQAGETKIQGLYVKPRSYHDFLRKYAANKRFLMEEGSSKILGMTTLRLALMKKPAAWTAILPTALHLVSGIKASVIGNCSWRCRDAGVVGWSVCASHAAKRM